MGGRLSGGSKIHRQERLSSKSAEEHDIVPWREQRKLLTMNKPVQLEKCWHLHVVPDDAEYMDNPLVYRSKQCGVTGILDWDDVFIPFD
jgi:hypothetical protein